MDAPGFDRQKALEQQIEVLILKKQRLENLIALACGIKKNGERNMDFSAFDTTKIQEYKKAVSYTHLLVALQKIMEENIHTYMPGFTHLQKAQPVTLAHHVGAYFEMFRRDRSRMADIRKRMNTCPLGAGALAGTTYPLDREYTAELLGFDEPTRNSMDSVSDRDYVIELLSALSTVMMHLSRFSEEIILWNSNEYRFVEIDDAYSTGTVSYTHLDVYKRQVYRSGI